jgi:hypothetical protein
VKPIIRACSAGALALSLAALSPATAALATTEPVSGATLLAAPTGLSPNDATVRKTVKLDWTAVAGATSYKVQVGRDSTWSDAPVYEQTAKVSQLTLPVSLPHGSYVWRVAAMKGSALGHWSSEATDPEFTRGWSDAPTTIAPAAPVVGSYPEFSWTPIPFASAYEVQVTNKAFIQGPGIQETAPGDVDTCFTARTRVTFFTEHVENGESNPGPCFSTLMGGGNQLYWRVRGLDRFTGAGASYSTDPAAHGIADVPWTGTPDPTVGSDCQGDTGGGCDPAAASEYSSWSPALPFTHTLAAPGGVFTTAAPTVHALTTDPDNVCLANSPSAGLTTCSDFPTVSWDPAPGTVRYRITVALDAAMSNVQRIDDLAGTQWTPTDSWAEGGPNKAYYVTVQACDDSTVCGIASTPVAFRKVTPRTAITSSVPPVTGEFTLAWKSYADTLATWSGQDETQDAYAYRVQVATSDHPSYDATVDDLLVDQTSYMPQVVYPDGAYVWRVQAVDSAGHGLPWSLSQSFTRDATPPKAISVSPSSNVAVTQPVKVNFSEPVSGVNAVSLGLSPAVAHTVTSVTPTSAVITPTAAMVPGATYRVVLTSAIVDGSGNTADPLGPTLKVKPQVDDSSKAFAYSAGWSVLSSSSATGGSYHGAVPTSTSPRTATMKFAGIGVNIDSCMGPGNGYLDVYVDNVKKARVSLYRSYTGCGVRVATITGLARATHTLKLVGVGSHPSGSKGNGVAVDYVTVYV